MLRRAPRRSGDRLHRPRRTRRGTRRAYGEAALPGWLRDSLINNLCQITECGFWAQPRPPLGDWAVPAGAFAMNESPRGCPHIANVPCDWYGNLPVVFFFAELARSNLRLFQAYQKGVFRNPGGKGGSPGDAGGVEIKAAEMKVDGVAESFAVAEPAR